MNILDFLFYYITLWFEKRRNKLTWSSPLQRASYAIGLATIAFLFAFDELLGFTVFKAKDITISKFIFVLIGLAIMQLYDFVYIKKQRFDKIKSQEFDFFKNIGEDKRSLVAVLIIVFFIFSPFLMFVLFIPFGIHSLK